jgi:D-aminoacyl-tRNA deacylase
MRAIVQRVSGASVRVDGRETGRCGQGLMLLIGIHTEDTPNEAKKLAQKIVNLRIFNDHEGKMNLSIQDFKLPSGEVEYDVLAVSNFTVYGDCKKQNRPSFLKSAGYEKGRELFEEFVTQLRNLGIRVQTGVFGANMQVSLVNDGPVTLVIDVDSIEIRDKL